MTVNTIYRIANDRIIRHAVKNRIGICDENFVARLTRQNVPDAIANHPDAANWLIMWDFLNDKSYGRKNRKMIIELINSKQLHMYRPKDFMADNTPMNVV